MLDIAKSKVSASPYLTQWDARSTIRTRPEKVIDLELKGYFFPEDKQPLLLNPKVQSMGEEIKFNLLLQSFFKYLHDITHLEIRLINQACDHLIYSKLPVTIPTNIKQEAYTVIIDEYYHVYLANQIKENLAKAYPETVPHSFPTSDAFLAVELISQRVLPEYRKLFEVIAVCIFETTLVRELVEFFNSESVHPSIKHYVNDHMNDESRHFAYFKNLLGYLWKEMDDHAKNNIGSQIGDFIKRYLNVKSDKVFNQTLLRQLFKDNIEADEVIEGLYQGFDITADVPIVKNVIKVLQQVDMYEHPAVKKGLIEENLTL